MKSWIWMLMTWALARALVPPLFAWWRRRDVGRDLEALASARKAELEPEDEFGLRLVRGESEGRAWTAAEVRCELRPLCPQGGEVRRLSLLALRVPLEKLPPVRFALTPPGCTPDYHEREWRKHTRVQGQIFALEMPMLDRHPDDRETGGKLDRLTSHTPGRELGGLREVRVSSGADFEALLDDELVRALRRAHREGLHELNVTPTSVNALVQLAPAATLGSHLELILEVAERVSCEV